MSQVIIAAEAKTTSPRFSDTIERVLEFPRSSLSVEVKRFFERVTGDPAFAELALKSPQDAARRCGVSVDPQTFRAAWDPEFKNEFGDENPTDEIADLREHCAAKIKYREYLFARARTENPRFAAWRNRQISRGKSELGTQKTEQIIHAPFAIELCRGCSVGCWFCGVSAPKLTDIWAYEEPNVTLWRGLLQVLKDRFGTAAECGFCYWATDPLDNPDYERFCQDFYEVLNIFPQTTTAMALKNPDRTRALLEMSEARGCAVNRFSLITLKQLLRVHEEFTADELKHVECICQNRESTLHYASAGRARGRNVPTEKRKQLNDEVQDVNTIQDANTIACVSGLLLNMLDRSVKLISPCAASDRWPLGYYVFKEGTFGCADELGEFIDDAIDSLAESVTDLPVVRFGDGLVFEQIEHGFEVSSRYQKTTQQHETLGPYFQQMGDLIRGGSMTADEIALALFYNHGIPGEASILFVESLFDLGVISELPS